MSTKTHKEPASVLEWLKAQSESTINQVLEELLRRPAVADQVGKLVQRAVKTKGQMDKNVEAVLHMLNLPSRSDLDKLRTKLDALHGTLVNLNMKLDRILAAQEQRKKRPASH